MLRKAAAGGPGGPVRGVRSRRRAAEKLERDTLAYYTSRTAEQVTEDEALSRASIRAAGKREIDQGSFVVATSAGASFDRRGRRGRRSR